MPSSNVLREYSSISSEKKVRYVLEFKEKIYAFIKSNLFLFSRKLELRTRYHPRVVAVESFELADDSMRNLDSHAD